MHQFTDVASKWDFVSWKEIVERDELKAVFEDSHWEKIKDMIRPENLDLSILSGGHETLWLNAKENEYLQGKLGETTQD